MIDEVKRAIIASIILIICVAGWVGFFFLLNNKARGLM